MAATNWTLVYQPSRFSPHLQPSGDVYRTWTEAESAYRTTTDVRLVEAWSVFLVPADATEQQVDSGKTLKIAPTAAVKAAAKERAAKIAALLATDDANARKQWGWSALSGFSRRLHGTGYAATREGAAEYAADNGMTWSDVCRTQA